MSTARPTLSATRREITGKKVATLRRSGQLPAVVYGNGLPSDNLTLDAKEFDLLRRHAGATTLVDLSIEGKKSEPVLVHAVQQHPVTRHPLHVDLYVVRMTEELTIEVALVSEGESEAVRELGGTLLHVIEHVRVKALPDKLPQSLHYSVEGLHTFEDVLHVSDLAIPEGVTLLTEPTEIIAKVLPPRVEEVEAPVAAAEGAEGEEAEAGGEAAGEGGSEGESSES
jgi:large subunit ribosomal protein L25